MIVQLRQKKSLVEAIDLKKKETIVVVGAGGKTSFCLALCDELKYSNKVIFTTTTKILPPALKDKYSILVGEQAVQEKYTENGTYIIGKEKSIEGKILPFDIEIIDKLKKKCDYLIIEGDGSKTKPLKGWNDNEPVFVNEVDKIVGVISAKAIDMEISDENIHRLDKFLNISKGKIGDKVSLLNLFNMISSKAGLFKDSKGKKVLLINQVESNEEINNSIELVKLIREKNYQIDKVIISSLKLNRYYTV